MKKLTKKEAKKALQNSYFIASVLESGYTIEELLKMVQRLTRKDVSEKAIYKVTNIIEKSNFWIMENSNNETSRRDTIGQFFLEDNIILHISNGFIMVNVQ